MARLASRVLGALLLLLPALLRVARAHGMMCTPRQRGAYHTDKCKPDVDMGGMDGMVTDYCPHCLNGGGKATVTANLPPGGWSVYEPTKNFFGTADRTGLCGDARAGEPHHMLGGRYMPYAKVPMVSQWRQGQTVDFEAEIDTNHNGYFEFFLCNLDACGRADMHPDCFVNGHCHKLQRVPLARCETPTADTIHECGPIDAAYPGRWYVPCRKTVHVGVHIVGGDSGTMRYQLPPDVRCEHCVVQWYWATANSCAPRGFKQYFVNYDFPFGTTCDSDGGARGTYSANMAECGGDAVPEEFWSCADVQISPDGAAPAVDVPAPAAPQPQEPVAVAVEPEQQPQPQTPQPQPDGFMAASEQSGEHKQQEEAAAAAAAAATAADAAQSCVAEDQACDGSVACCDAQGVCVYLDDSLRFRCRTWWRLAPHSER